MQKSIIFALVAGVQTLVSSFAANAQTLTLKWEVENRFRFYRNATTFQYYAKAAQHALSGSRKDWILSTERQLQQQYYLPNERANLFPEIERNKDDRNDNWNGWASLTRGETCWNRINHQQIKEERCEDYISPVTHTVVVTASGAAAGAHCQWTISTSATAPRGQEDLWKARMKLNADLMMQQPPCLQSVKVEVPWAVDGSASADVAVKVVSGGAPPASGGTSIIVEDILVVGMGDSFAAGVGNPDKPAQMDWGAGITYPPYVTKYVPVRSGGNDNSDLPTRAVFDAQGEWQDARCFRSQYGPQFRTALHMAVLMEQTAVTYLDLSCNGARIIEGLLNEQSLGRGYQAHTAPPEAQIGLASRLLCADPNSKKVMSYKLHWAHQAGDCSHLKPGEICEYWNRKYQDENNPSTSMNVCNHKGLKPFVRDIDILLLSIGGNDIGFAPMVGDVIIDDSSVKKRLGKLIGGVHSGSIGEQRLAILNSKYVVLNQAIRDFLPLWPGAKKPIFLTAYPVPVDDAHGKLCGSPENSAAANAALDISTFFSRFGNSENCQSQPESPVCRLRSVVRTTCLLNLRRFGWFDGGAQAQMIIGEMTDKAALCANLEDQAKLAPGDANLGWQYVGEDITSFSGHGFCADGEHAAKIPLLIHGGTDHPWDPDYQSIRPYTSRKRWVRSPNDAYVVTNWLTGQVDLHDFLNLLSATTTSAMHPTAEGYAAMADALLGRVTTFICTERKTEFGREPLCGAP
jgi:hypothetical protein